MKNIKKFKLIGSRKGKFVLFVSPCDYFGSNGFKTYTDTFEEAIKIISDDKNTTMFIRLQCDRPNRKPDFYRVLLRPGNEGHYLDGTNYPELTDRLFHITSVTA